MIHEMRLAAAPFEKIRSGSKKVELRLNDEKRRKISVGDEIVFTNLATCEKLRVQVTGKRIFKDFRELYAAYPAAELGYQKSERASFEDMNKYYSDEEILKYGVVGIGIQII